MGDLDHLSGRTPLQEVDAEALIRFWRFTEQHQAETPLACISYDIRLVQDQVGPGCDPISALFRTGLLKMLFQRGLLDDWREGAELRRVVFDVAASFPIPNGVEGFDAEVFLNEVRIKATGSPA